MTPIAVNIDLLHATAEYFLMWIGFGTLVGLVAYGITRAMSSGREPGGSVLMLIIAILGCLTGCAVLYYLQPNAYHTPLTREGFMVGITGAILLLLGFRSLGGYYFAQPGGEGPRPRRRRRRRYVPYE